MKFGTILAAAAAAVVGVVADQTTAIENAVNLLNGTAYSFANHTSLIAQGDVVSAGTLYNVQMDLINLSAYIVGVTMPVKWMPSDNNDTNAVAVESTTLQPILVQINNGLINMINKVAFLPANNDPIPDMLNDFLDSFNRLVTDLEITYPTRSAYIAQLASAIQTNIQLISQHLAGVPVTLRPAVLSKRACAPGSDCSAVDQHLPQPVPANDGPEYGHLPTPSKRHITCPPGDLHCTGFPEQGEEESINFKRAEDTHTDCPLWATRCIGSLEDNEGTGFDSFGRRLNANVTETKDVRVAPKDRRQYTHDLQYCLDMGDFCALVFVDQCVCIPYDRKMVI